MKWKKREDGTMETFEGSEGWASCFATDGGLLQTDKAAGSFDKGSALPPPQPPPLKHSPLINNQVSSSAAHLS